MAKPRRSRRPRTTLIILVLVSLTIITLDLRGGLDGLVSGSRSAAADAFSPVQSAVDDVVRPIGSFLAGTIHYGSVREQNQKLQAEIGAMRQQEIEQGDAAQALKQLQALSRMDNLPYLSNLQTVKAEVIDFNASNFAATIEIDVGRDQGVALNMPVVGSSGGVGGLVGQVVQCNRTTATVRLITDGQSVVGVTYGQGSTTSAILDGQGNGKPLSAQLIPPNTPVKVGQTLFTSGMQGAIFPPGFPVATVISADTGSAANQETVLARPSTNLAQLRYVSVVLWGPAGGSGS